MSRYTLPLPKLVRLIQIRIYVPVHRLFERSETAIISCSSQVFDSRLRKILILLLDGGRHRDVLDVRSSPERAEHGRDQIAEAAGLTGPHVENAGYSRC